MKPPHTFFFRWDRFDSLVLVTALCTLALVGVYAASDPLLPHSLGVVLFFSLLVWSCSLAVPLFDAIFRVFWPTCVTVSRNEAQIDYSGRIVRVASVAVRSVSYGLRGCLLEQHGGLRPIRIRGANQREADLLRELLEVGQIPKPEPEEPPPQLSAAPPTSDELAEAVLGFPVPLAAARGDAWVSEEELRRSLCTLALAPSSNFGYRARKALAGLLTIGAIGYFALFGLEGNPALIVVGWIASIKVLAALDPPEAPRRLVLLADQVVAEFSEVALRVPLDDLLDVRTHSHGISLYRRGRVALQLRGASPCFAEALQTQAENSQSQP